MPDTDSRYVIPYAVWIPGLGWLKKNNRVFVDARREVAETAAWLWGDGAYVVPHDMNEYSKSALVDLELDFLNQEAKRNARRLVNQIRILANRLFFSASTQLRVILHKPRGILDFPWLCPRCGHINSKEKCIICGLSRR